MSDSSSTNPLHEINANEIEKVRSIGSGVYGMVYLCKCRGFYCAVKTLKPRAKPRNMTAFVREMQIMQKLFHPNICLYMGACADPPMIVTEYVPRGDLCNLLASGEPLSLCLRVKMATDAATGMSWLHEMKPERVLHRDLKCLARHTPVLMYDGSVRPVQQVRVGDCVMGDDSTPRRVLSVARGRQAMVRVASARSSSTSSSSSSDSSSSTSSSRRRRRDDCGSGAAFTCNTAHVLSLKLRELPSLQQLQHDAVLRCAVAQRAPDGTVARLRLATCRVPRRVSHQLFAARATASSLATRKHRLRTLLCLDDASEPVARDETVDIAVACLLDRSAVSPALRTHLTSYFAGPLSFGRRVAHASPSDAYAAGLLVAKHSNMHRLSHKWKYGAIDVRRALLAALIDVSPQNEAAPKTALLAHGNESLLVEASFVAQSLGLHATHRFEQVPPCLELRGRLSQLPCCQHHFADDERALRESLHLTLLPDDEFFGFSLDGNQRFVLGDSFKVTHNSKNLLVDNLYRVKVADFGLSQLLPDGMAGQDSTAMRGTPLWNAPEVLNRQVFTEKCDIYSFAICLWELLTRNAPFQSYGISTLDQLIYVVCEREERPRLPASTPEALVQLLNVCWHPSPDERPPFREIVPVLEKLIVHSAVSDEYAANLWAEAFGASDPIAWSNFLPAFLLQLQLTPNMVSALCDDTSPEHGKLPDTARITVQCLRRYLCGPVISGGSGGHVRADARHANDSGVSVVDADASDVVWLERYGASMDVFRPLPGDRYNAAALLDELASLCATGWFHGHVTRSDAHERLQMAPPGTFLVRCSASSGVGHWAISFVRAGADGTNTIAHRRIRHNLDGFALEGSANAASPPGLVPGEALRNSAPEHAIGSHTLLSSLIQKAAEPLGLTTPATGSPFERLFLQSATHTPDAGYD